MTSNMSPDSQKTSSQQLAIDIEGPIHRKMRGAFSLCDIDTICVSLGSEGSTVPHCHVALLRGINVGKAKRVAMADLRKLVEGLGYGNVSTLLNSGNVVFSTPKSTAGPAASRIEKAIAEKLEISCRVIVISAAELATSIAENPLLTVADNPSRLMVGVLATPEDRAKLKALQKQDWSPETLAVGTRVIYYWIPAGIIDSKLATAVARALGDTITTRNWATMLKLHELTKLGSP